MFFNSPLISGNVENPKILIIGDSLAHGFCNSPTKAFKNVLCISHFGMRSHIFQQNLDDCILDYIVPSIKYVVWILGNNDDHIAPILLGIQIGNIIKSVQNKCNNIINHFWWIPWRRSKQESNILLQTSQSVFPNILPIYLYIDEKEDLKTDGVHLKDETYQELSKVLLTQMKYRLQSQLY